MMRHRVVVVGSGSLACSLACSVAEVCRRPTDVWVLARSAAAADQVAYLATATARLSRSAAAFHAASVDLGRREDVECRLRDARPEAILLCASHHSPWEAMAAPSPWTALVERAGFGVTLPLQAALAVEVARAAVLGAPEAMFINACLPDAVNPVLAALGLPVLCGIGNAGLLAASLQAALGLADQRGLQVLAHHVHLHHPAGPEREALAWHDGAPLADVSALLEPQRATGRRELNRVTGLTAALLVRDLLEEVEVHTSLPGPLGLPGGYPVRVRGRRLELRLPSGLTRAAAIRWNQAAAVHDGVRVDGPRVDFSPEAERELRPHLPGIAAGFPTDRIRDACERMLELRDRLRGSATATALAVGGGAQWPIP